MGTFRQTRTILIASAMVPLLSGCIKQWEAQSRVDPRTVAYFPGLEPAGAKDCALKPQQGDYRADVVRLSSCPADAKKPEPQLPYQLYEAARTDPTARNRLASMLIKQSDDVCVVELGNLTAREAMVKTGLGTLTSLLSSISSFVTGDRAKTLFSTGATFTNATRDHIEAQVYRNLMSTAVVQSIDEDRAATRNALTAKFDDNPNDYTVDQMVMEVNRYHQSCSFYHGIGLVLKKLNQDNAGSGLSKLQALNYAIDGLDAEIKGEQGKLNTMSGAAKEAQEKALAELITKRKQLVLDRAALGTGPISNSEPAPSGKGPDKEPADPSNPTGNQGKTDKGG